MQKWKKDPKLHSCETEKKGFQVTKKLDYSTTYKKEFLESDPLRDWESIERCKWLFNWCRRMIENKHTNLPKRPIFESVLDIGTKDAQFPAWLRDEVGMKVVLGVEYSEEYVRYAINKERPIIWGNACDLNSFDDNEFDLVFSHHLHGLTPDYQKALDEMFRVSRSYMVALNQVPGNKRKHYSYIGSPEIFHDFVRRQPCKVIYNDYLDTGYKNEWVIFVRKK